MDIGTIKGFKEILGKPTYSYSELLDEIPTEVVIFFLIVANSQLNAPPTDSENQESIFKIFTNTLRTDQPGDFEGSFEEDLKTQLSKMYFGRRYLLAMMTKELARNNSQGKLTATPEQKLRILMAYLLIVDELNDNDEIIIKKLAENGDVFYRYKMLWLSFIDQYEFNDNVNVAFEYIKLMCITKYCYINLKPYLKELLSNYNFPNLSQFFYSSTLLLKATIGYNPELLYPKLAVIRPEKGVDTSHLTHQSINHLLGKVTVSIPDIRKHPLYETVERDFLIIDENIYKRKIYRGPFFEIYYQTSLRKQKDFNTYSTIVSKGAMEEICFRSICNQLAKSGTEVIHFDNDNSQSQPDLYSRCQTTIVMIEYKDYIFKEALSKSYDFEEFKKYIDSKFVRSEKGKPKGISQLSNQIELLQTKKYLFDPELIRMLEDGEATRIYPVLCFTDFIFSMPGINDYLNYLFGSLPMTRFNNVSVQPVTMINIEKLFDYSLRNGTLEKLPLLLDRYKEILSAENQLLAKGYTSTQFVRAMGSFDEVYDMGHFDEFFSKNFSETIQNDLIKAVSLTQEQINENL